MIIKKTLFKNPLFWLLAAVFFKGIVWSGVVPLWHFPDEQAHFAQLQNIAERKKILHISEISTSREIYESELALGVFRDDRGNNLYTYHPEYNIPYTKTFDGLEEERIKSLGKRTRLEMKISEATGYPHLYYALGAFFYLIFFGANLFARVFIVRLFSVILGTATVWLACKIGKLVFKNNLYAVCLGLLVGFQPMFSFVSSGVTSDVLFNFFFTLFIFSVLRFFTIPDLKSYILIFLSLAGGLLTKQQMMIAVLLSPIVVVKMLLLFFKKKRKFSLKTVLSLIIISGGLLFFSIRYGEVFRIFGFIKAAPDQEKLNISLLSHFVWTARHTIAEILPWYWGVFKWLGVVLPRWANRAQMRILGLSVVGLMIWGLRIIRRKKIKARDWQIVFLALSAGAYFLAVTLWDWEFRKAYGFSFGIQGRYFFPTITAHMALVLVGLTNLLPKKFTKWLAIILSGWWLVLSFIGLWTIITAYYQVWPLPVFWRQISQYKPFWFKAEWWFLWGGLYLVSLAGLIINFIKEFIVITAKK